MLLSIENRLERIMQMWVMLASLASAVRIVASPNRGPMDFTTVAPYLLLVLAPLTSMVLALRWFADADQLPQPATRLARIGAWRSVPGAKPTRHHGPAPRPCEGRAY